MWSVSIAATIATCAIAASADAGPVVVTEKPGHTTQVTVTVDASPKEVYRVATEYARWPTVLADVTAVKIKRGGRRDARLKFRSKALGREVSIQFDNEPDRAVRFRGVDGPPGSQAYGEYRFEPIAGGRTRITATFMLHAGGISGLFVSGSTIDRMRRAKLEADLVDLARCFARVHD
jgi:uncharacterized membrane protein